MWNIIFQRKHVNQQVERLSDTRKHEDQHGLNFRLYEAVSSKDYRHSTEINMQIIYPHNDSIIDICKIRYIHRYFLSGLVKMNSQK